MTKYDTPDAIWEGIVPCALHRHFMDGCEHCDAEMTARSARIDQMQAEAQRVLTDIAHNGGPGMPPSVMLEARLDVLCDSIFTDPKDRIRYEGEVGRRVMQTIKNMQATVKQPTLHVARDIPQGLKRR